MEQFGDYELIRRLGRGGMAETFVARRLQQDGLDRRVCLKRILHGLCDEPNIREMFLVEAKLSARLHHMNIARVLDFGEVNGDAFLVLELVDGFDLRYAMTNLFQNQRELLTDIGVEVACALGHALEFAHAVDRDGTVLGIVHRDISPSNVLLSVSGDIKLADFGIAKAIGHAVHTQTGTLKGKIPYMPAEYALSGVYDARSDLFSLGVTLYETFTGRRPFDGKNDIDTLQRIAHGQYHKLVDYKDLTIPLPLCAAVDRLITREPKDRFQTAAAFLDAIAPYSPSKSTRRALGTWARAAQAEQLQEQAAYERPTEAIIEGTRITDDHVPAPLDPAVESAPADERTRTRLITENH